MCREICNNHVSGYFTLLPRFYNLAIRFLQPSVYAQISLMNCCQKGDLGDGNVANCETHIPLVYLCFIKNGKVLFLLQVNMENNYRPRLVGLGVRIPALGPWSSGSTSLLSAVYRYKSQLFKTNIFQWQFFLSVRFQISSGNLFPCPEGS